jgi:PAS domain S-box-containing protein
MESTVLENDVDDLRSLYRSSRRMAVSDDVSEILDYLVRDLIDSTGFDRIMILQLDRMTHFLESQVYYGFKDVSRCNYRVFFDNVNGLLRKVYKDREPLNVVDFKDLKRDEGGPPQNCGILKDSYRSSKGKNRRARINLCVPDLASCQSYSAQSGQYQHYTVMHMKRHDETVSHLLGDITSFLILPICDEKSFYGYVLADSSLSEKEITYEEIRQSISLVSHAACSVGRALTQKKMLNKIAAQLTDIQEIKNFYQSIIQNLRSGLIIVNQFMKISEVNKAAEFLSGYHGEELLGKPLEYLFADKNKNNKCFYIDVVDDMDTCMGALAEIPMRKKDGEIIPTEACFSVIKDINDNISGLSCIFQDITTRKTKEQNLARSDKLASLGELASSMAHEIKNPLAGIAGAMQVMAKNYHTESPYHFVFNEVQEQVKRLDSFVNNLVQFARPGQINFSDIDVKGLTDKVLILAMRQLEEKKIAVTKSYGDELSLVQGDAGQLQQVLLNIVFNAIDAMEEGGTLTIQSQLMTVSTTTTTIVRNKSTQPSCVQNSAMMKVSISDTGYGIDEECLEKIFNPFYTTKCKGTGLGLSISHRIIEQHGGAITVKSSPGVGSIFTVLLTVYEASAPLRKTEDTVLGQIRLV